MNIFLRVGFLVCRNHLNDHTLNAGYFILRTRTLKPEPLSDLAGACLHWLTFTTCAVWWRSKLLRTLQSLQTVYGGHTHEKPYTHMRRQNRAGEMPLLPVLFLPLGPWSFSLCLELSLSFQPSWSSLPPTPPFQGHSQSLLTPSCDPGPGLSGLWEGCWHLVFHPCYVAYPRLSHILFDWTLIPLKQLRTLDMRTVRVQPSSEPLHRRLPTSSAHRRILMLLQLLRWEERTETKLGRWLVQCIFFSHVSKYILDSSVLQETFGPCLLSFSKFPCKADVQEPPLCAGPMLSTPLCTGLMLRTPHAWSYLLTLLVHGGGNQEVVTNFYKSHKE